MGTTRTEISAWFDEGVTLGATHMLVVCDTYDWSDYPVYVAPIDDVRTEARNHDGPNMTQLMEVYCLGMDKAMQLAEARTFHYEPAEFRG